MLRRKGVDELKSAERFGQRRSLVLILFTLAFVMFGLSWLLQVDGFSGRALSSMDGFRGAAWATWGIAVLVATFHPRWARPTPAQMSVLNDELTLAHRRTAQALGYWLLLAGAAGLLVGRLFFDLNAALALTVLVTGGVAVPSLTFSLLQRRADGDA